MFDPLYEYFQLVRDLPKGEFAGNSDGDFVTIFGRFVHGVRRDSIGLGPRYLAGVNRVMRRVEVPTTGIRECRVAFYLCTLCRGYFFPFRVAGRSIVAAQTRPNKGRSRLVVKLRSNFRRFQRILHLLPYFVGQGAGQDGSTRIRRRIVCRVFRFSIVIAPRRVTRHGSILSTRQVVKGRDVRPIFKGVLGTFRVCFYIRGIRAHF